MKNNSQLPEKRYLIGGLSPEQEAQAIADCAFENEYSRLEIIGVDARPDDGCDLCAGLTLD